MEEHYKGDDTTCARSSAALSPPAGISVDEFEQQADSFLHTAQHPTLGRDYVECGYAPMVELLRYLAERILELHRLGRRPRLHAADQRGDVRDPARPRDRGSIALDYAAGDDGGTIMRKPEADVLDDGLQKPIRIWSRIGRRPLLAAGNSNRDIPMLDFTQHADKPTLRLLVLHDDAEREFAYTAGAEDALERARTEGWTVVGIANDWATVFA